MTDKTVSTKPRRHRWWLLIAIALLIAAGSLGVAYHASARAKAHFLVRRQINTLTWFDYVLVTVGLRQQHAQEGFERTPVQEWKQLGPKATPALLAMIDDPDRRVVDAACQGLECIRDPAAVQALEARIKTEKNPTLRDQLYWTSARMQADGRYRVVYP